MSEPLRLSMTEVAIGARCARQFVLAREGFRVMAGGQGIGAAAHQVLARFVERGAAFPSIEKALARPGQDLRAEEAIQRAVSDFAYRCFHEVAGEIAPRALAADLVELGSISRSLSVLLAALLARAWRAGHAGAAAFSFVFEASERPVSLSMLDGEVEVGGVLDLLCRDAANGQRYVADLKTFLSDRAAEEQVRLYALALAREGIVAAPALVHVGSGQIAIRRIELESGNALAGVERRARALRAYESGEAVPPAAAEPAICRGCPVQSRCWARWGRTLGPSAEGPEQNKVDTNSEGKSKKDQGKSGLSNYVVREATKLEKVLRAHKVPLESLDPARAIVGPTVVRYRVKLRVGSRFSRLGRLATDLQRDMAWEAEPRLESGPEFVSIDAPRAEREAVPWRAAGNELLSGLNIPVGLTLERAPLLLDLAEAPHVLVGGSTGSGKTVFLQSLALALLPRGDCQVAIVDPKMVDFALFTSRRLYRPVITDVGAAVDLITQLAEEELPARADRLKKLKVTERRQIPRGAASMPAIVLIVDEFADLVQSLPDKAGRAAFLGSTQRLLQKARFVGIHLVLATQRASVDAVPGLLKANLPVRIAFRLPDALNSSIILDEPGAEALLGKGDLLLKRDGRTVRAQGFLVGAEDILAAQG